MAFHTVKTTEEMKLLLLLSPEVSSLEIYSIKSFGLTAKVAFEN